MPLVRTGGLPAIYSIIILRKHWSLLLVLSAQFFYCMTDMPLMSQTMSLSWRRKIIWLSLPPYSSHLLQPLDLAVFKSLKVQWGQKLCIWQRQHTGMRIPKKQFAMLFGDMWNRVNPDIIKNGFRKGGICPFDKTVIPKEKYNPPAL